MLKQTNMTDPRLERVRSVLLTKGKGRRRSPLWHWMRQNHDGLSALFEQAPPAWAVLAGTFGGMGLTDREGKSPTARTTRMTWYRVRLDIRRSRSRRAGPAAGHLAPGITFTPPMPSSSPPPLPLDLESGDPEPAPRRFGLAHPRGHRPSAILAPSPSPVPGRVQRSPEEVERIVADLMRDAPHNSFRRDKGD